MIRKDRVVHDAKAGHGIRPKTTKRFPHGSKPSLRPQVRHMPTHAQRDMHGRVWRKLRAHPVPLAPLALSAHFLWPPRSTTHTFTARPLANLPIEYAFTAAKRQLGLTR